MKLNMHEAKTHLSAYVEALEQGGEPIVLCRRNQPIAEIRALAKEPQRPRPIGLWKHEFQTPESFFDELPEEILSAFEGE